MFAKPTLFISDISLQMICVIPEMPSLCFCYLEDSAIPYSVMPTLQVFLLMQSFGRLYSLFDWLVRIVAGSFT